MPYMKLCAELTEFRAYRTASQNDYRIGQWCPVRPGKTGDRALVSAFKQIGRVQQGFRIPHPERQ